MMGQTSSSTAVFFSFNKDDSIQLDVDMARKLNLLLRTLAEKGIDMQALAEWSRVTNKTFRTPLEQWIGLNFAIRCLERLGRHRLMLAFIVRQIEIAHEINENGITEVYNAEGESMGNTEIIAADSYLNLSRANFLLSNYNKCLDYLEKCRFHLAKARQSIKESILVNGYALLLEGKSKLCLGQYQEALNRLEKSIAIAHSQTDTELECLVCCAMGELYLSIRDFEKATFFPMKASEIISNCDQTEHKRQAASIQVSLAEAYRKVGKLDEALELSEDAMNNSIQEHDKLTQAYCMLCFADVHRVRKDSERALPRYESASALMNEIGDKYGQSLVATGKAKAYLRSNDYHKALSQYANGLHLAESIGHKMACFRINGELAVLYQRMSNHQQAKSCTVRYHQLLEEMNLFCGICKQPFGERQEQLEALPCSHLFHLRCLADQCLTDTNACPICRVPSSMSSSTP